MGDSTTMTIEFLRARLLSERSISRSAKQRADQLARRVVELEEQLRLVTIQRRKAEKAAAEVLSILETQGIGDFSEVINSSSDRDEVPAGEKGSDDNEKEDETSTTSRMDRSEVEDGLSGSEIEVAPSPGRSLSWKSCSNSPDSLEKKKVNQVRQRQRRNSFVSTAGSSPKHHLGKSCRKIKRKETGTMVENGKVGGRVAEDFSNCLDDATHASETTGENEEEKLKDPVSSSLEVKSKEANEDLYANGGDKDEEMERALQQQAQLIGQFEAEENAQREWEEKYNENNSSALDSREPDKQPNIAEGRNLVEVASRVVDETLCHDPEPKCTIEEPTSQGPSKVDMPANQTSSGTSSDQSYRSENATATNFSTDPIPADTHTYSGPTFSADNDVYMVQRHRRVATNESGASFEELEFPGPLNSGTETNGKQDNVLQDGISEAISHCNTSLQPHVHGVHESTSTESLSSARSSGKFTKGEWPEIQNQYHRTIPEALNSGLGSVLESLERAKLSLRRELDKSQQRRPPLSQGGWATMPFSVMPSQGARATIPSSPMPCQGAWVSMPSSPMPSQGALAVMLSSAMPSEGGWATSPSPSIPSQAAWATATNSQALAIKVSETMNIPIGTAGLFRLPTDISPQVDICMPSYYSSGSSFPTGRAANAGFTSTSATSGQQYPVNPYMEPESRLPVRSQYQDNYMEPESRLPARRQYLDNYINTGTRIPAPTSNRYTYPMSDLAAGTTSFDGFRNPYMDMKGGMPAGDQDRYSMHGLERSRPDTRGM